MVKNTPDRSAPRRARTQVVNGGDNADHIGVSEILISHHAWAVYAIAPNAPQLKFPSNMNNAAQTLSSAGSVPQSAQNAADENAPLATGGGMAQGTHPASVHPGLTRHR